MMRGEIAPVVLFVFNRPRLTAQVYERIRAARPERLLVVGDGPRAGRSEDVGQCLTVREMVSHPDWSCELLTNWSDENLGVLRRLSSGLDWVFRTCSEAIILEDDCVPCRSFFEYSSQLLRRYREDSRIMHVSGNNYQDGRRRDEASYFFSRYTLSWGWATWRRAWRHYDVKMSMWPTAYRKRWLEGVVRDRAEVEFWEEVFDRAYRGLIDTWDYQWLFACWWHGGLAIQPNENLVTNVGIGPDATHFQVGHSTLGIPAREMGGLVHPSEIVRDEEADRYTFRQHIAGNGMTRNANWIERIRRELALRTRLRRVVPRIMRYRVRGL
jgi:hypothetical protein